MTPTLRKLLLSAGAAAALLLTAAPGLAAGTPEYGTWGFDLSGMDRSAKPGDDFYRFANGKWADRTEIPADRVSIGAFDALVERSLAAQRAILEDAAAGRLDGPDAARLAAGYKAFMDTALAEKLDAQPIAPALARLREVKTKDQLTALMGTAAVSPFSTILTLYPTIDQKAPNRYAVYAFTSGQGLPDRDYYLQPAFAEKKAKYQAYVQQMLTMIGWDRPAEHAAAVVAFETRLAEASWTRAERRNPDRTYNPKTLTELQALTPGFSWKAYLPGTGLPKDLDRVVVTTDTAFPKIAAIYAETPLDTLKAWQAFNVADGAAPYLSKRFVDAVWGFRSHELGGQPEQRPRWKRAVGFMDGAVGEAVGRAYAARYFPPEAKAKVDAMIGDIRAALRHRIETVDWMSADTRRAALDKLDRLVVKIGYPATWRDYSALEFRADDPYGNAMRANQFEWRRVVDRLKAPVDKAEWVYTPQTVNAYYNPPNNEIVFLAAILQPPFFDPNADPAVNYGGIGAVIGHEISHGFDDTGRKYDADGALRDWWTPEDNAKFHAQAERLGAQYSAFEPLPGAHVQGALTMGENIGDMGGLSLALDAYRNVLKGRPAPIIDGLTGDQRVFLGFAQLWRERMREETLRQRLSVDTHSPAIFRVNGTIRNIPAWYDAFGAQPGDKLYVAPADRVKIW